MSKRFPVIWLTGNSGAGKTTLAYGIRDYFNEQTDLGSPFARRVVVLDGDEMRKTISVDEGFSPADRRRHNHRVARLANLIADHGLLVIVAVIAPFEKVRRELAPICSPKWIYLKRRGLEDSQHPYEPPASPDLVIDNDELSIEDARSTLISYLKGLEVGSGKPKDMPVKQQNRTVKI